jgi:RNA ligase (TIGR02306 family)
MNETEYENCFVRHDVELFHMFKDEFIEGEMVDLTEKVHGSQVNIMLDESGKVTLTSKYLGQEGFVVDEDPNNNYWRAAKNSGLLARLRCEDPKNHTPLCGCTRYKGLNVQVCAEMIPCQKGFSYGFKEPTLRVFKLVIGGRVIPLSEVAGNDFFFMKDIWVPYIACVPFTSAGFAQYADGREQVSGKELHIREGVVVTPVVPRNDSEGHGLAVKYLNSKFKGAASDIA